MRYFISEFIVSMLDSIMLFITQVYQTVIAFPAIGVDRALKATLPRITACSLALEQLGTIFVYTLPLRFNNPNTMVLPLAPRPRLPLVRRAPKKP